MAKKILVAIFILFLLSSCISITKVSESPLSQQDFVTATLAPTVTRWILPTLTVSPAATALFPGTTVRGTCTDAAILLRDVTVPDNTRVKAGETFIKTWEFQNTGTCPWIGYTVKFSTGDSMNAPLSAPLADTVPGQNIQISVELIAPSADGAYSAYFTLNDPAGNAIPVGTEKSFWVRVLVGDIVPAQNAGVPFVATNLNPNCTYSENAGFVSEIIFLINQARADANLPALNVNAQLTQAAQAHSVDMACSNLLSHFGSDGSGWWDRIARTDYFSTHGPSVAEIIAIGTPQDAINQWRSDLRHWEFILAANTEFGVGYAYYSQSDFGGYFAVDFGN